MSQKISIRQVKAARALLDWSQADLAEKSGVSLPTIRRLEAEDGMLGGTATTGDKIQEALEKGGVEFLFGVGRGAGVRARAQTILSESFGLTAATVADIFRLAKVEKSTDDARLLGDVSGVELHLLLRLLQLRELELYSALEGIDLSFAPKVAGSKADLSAERGLVLKAITDLSSLLRDQHPEVRFDD